MRIIEQPVHQRNGFQNVAAAPEINRIVPVGGHAPEPANLKRARFLHDLWVTGAAAAIVLIVNCHDVTIDEVDPSLLAGYRKHMRVGSGLVRKQQDSARTEVIVVDTKTGLVVGSEVVRERQRSIAEA